MVQLFIYTGCDQGIIPGVGGKTTVEKGSVTGVAKYSNASDASDIIVTLENTDGLRSLNVVRSARVDKRNNRSIVGITEINSEGRYYFNDIETGVYTLYAVSENSMERAVKTGIVITANNVVTAED